MSIMTQLEFQLEFTHLESELANYILENGEDVINDNIKTFASKTYCSPATIVRFTKKLGLSGFGDFKIKYSAELQADHKIKNRIDVNYPFHKEDSHSLIAQKIASLSNEAIEDTLSLIDFKVFEKVIDSILRAKRIFLFGSGNSILASLDFQHKMTRIGKNVEMREIEGEQIFLSYQCTSKDVALILSYSGETHELIRIANILKKNKVPLIGITSLGENQLKPYCHYILNTGSREKIFNKIAPYSSKISMEYLLNIIFSCVFNEHYEDNKNYKLDKDRIYDQRHPNNSPINE